MQSFLSHHSIARYTPSSNNEFVVPDDEGAFLRLQDHFVSACLLVPFPWQHGGQLQDAGVLLGHLLVQSLHLHLQLLEAALQLLYSVLQQGGCEVSITHTVHSARLEGNVRRCSLLTMSDFFLIDFFNN